MSRRHALPLTAIMTLLAFMRPTAQSAESTGDYSMTPVPFDHVKIDGGFWGKRIETNREVTVWSNLRKCEETGRLSNFAKAAKKVSGSYQGLRFNDSDVFKVIEGASYSLTQHPDAKLSEYLDVVIADIAAAQEDDGYLYTPRTVNDPNYNYVGKEARWSDLARGHELYNVGHLYEAAVAHFRATGKRTLLDVAIKNADLICHTFGPGPGQLIDVPGHEEIEIGLVKLYRTTGQHKYLDLAQFFIDMRGRKEKRKGLYGQYSQDHIPVIEQNTPVGHAVRAMYLYSGMTDVAALTGNKQYTTALDRIWQNMVSKQLYLTGGIGARRSGEAFGEDYELPNDTAYNETCAAIGNALWNYRMFLLHGDAKYLDILERVLYNGFLSGVSLHGDTFFYPNPLSCDGHTCFNHGSLERSPWFTCSCCPVNVVRFMPSIPGMVYAKNDRSIYINLYMSSTGQLEIDGNTVQLTQETDYPWNGDVSLTVSIDKPADFEIRLRIPSWAQGRPLASDLYRYSNANTQPVDIKINDKQVPSEIKNGFASLQRKWESGDKIDLHLPMPVRRVLCKADVSSNVGRVAIERGPIVYCIEGFDHDGPALRIALPNDSTLSPQARPTLLGGVTVLRGIGKAVGRDEEERRVVRDVELTAIPYYAWCNRGPNEMAVWIPRNPDTIPAPSRSNSFTPTASHCNRNDSVRALNDGWLPSSSSDHDIIRMTWWDHQGTQEWVQYDFPNSMKVTGTSVYWFDDGRRGSCRVPQSWKILYRDNGEWKPVSGASQYGVDKNRFNEVRFDPVQTDALRLVVQLQPKASGGVLEWRVDSR